MYKQLSKIMLITFLFSGSLLAMGKPGRTCKNIFTPVYNVLATVLKWPYKKIGGAFMEGALDKAKDSLIPKIDSKGKGEMVEIIEDAHDSQMQKVMFDFFEGMSEITDPYKKRAVGSKFIKNLLRSAALSAKELFDSEGEGREAFENFFKSFEAFLEEKGVIKDMAVKARRLMLDELREVRQTMSAEFKEVAKDLRETMSAELKNYFEEIKQLNEKDGEAHTAVHAVAKNLASGVNEIGEAVDTNSRKIVRNVLIGSVLVISSWFIWKHVDRNLRTPALVLETSYKNYLQRLGTFIFGSKKKPLPQMILAPDLKERLNTIAAAVRNTRVKIKAGQKNVKYRNLLLWGPPGTGKTMFARVLAQYSGMDYVIMSGSSFAQYRNGEGITQMNKLFEWANNTDGLIVFVDEAEAFLGGREGADISSDSYQLLTNFLNHTGERSDKVMFVFATNYAKALDPAMKRRIDDAVHMPLPELEQRKDILKLYRDTLILDETQNSQEFISAAKEALNDAIVSSLAEQTKGLSGGELEGIINSLITDASVTKDGLITQELIISVVGHAINKHDSFTQGFEVAAAA